MKKNDLIYGNIGKAILLFVLPLIAGSLIQQLYVTVDAIIVGRFAGKVGLAAIDSVNTLFKFPINFMNGLASGATIIISKYVGAKDKENLHCSIRTALTVAMVLGDNIFAGHGLKKKLRVAVENAQTGKGATIFGYYVDDPERFGIVEFDKGGKAISIEEKPEKPKSNYCVTGLYFYDNRVVEYAKNLRPSARGELEITDLNRIYLESGNLNVKLLGQGFTWLDTGTHESLAEATNFVKTVEQHQHRKIGCLEEIAYLNGWITKEDVFKVYEVLKKNQYGQYLKDILDGKYQENLY